jgi:ABC-type Na+ transport system ATPase subunit NatA
MTYAANIPIKNLSELEIQKLAITKALYCDSEVVIIDDDFFICDEKFVAKVRDTVSLQKNSGRSFIFSVVRGRELTGLVDRQVNCRFC